MEGSFSSVINGEDEHIVKRSLRNLFRKKHIEDVLVEKNFVMPHRDSMNLMKSEPNLPTVAEQVLVKSIAKHHVLKMKHRSSVPPIKRGGAA